MYVLTFCQDFGLPVVESCIISRSHTDSKSPGNTHWPQVIVIAQIDPPLLDRLNK
jgi:hypothetical protein